MSKKIEKFMDDRWHFVLSIEYGSGGLKRLKEKLIKMFPKHCNIDEDNVHFLSFSVGDCLRHIF